MAAPEHELEHDDGPASKRLFALIALETAEDDWRAAGFDTVDLEPDQSARSSQLQYLASIASSLVRIADRLERIDHGQDRVGDAIEDLAAATRQIANRE